MCCPGLEEIRLGTATGCRGGSSGLECAGRSSCLLLLSSCLCCFPKMVPREIQLLYPSVPISCPDALVFTGDLCSPIQDAGQDRRVPWAMIHMERQVTVFPLIREEMETNKGKGKVFEKSCLPSNSLPVKRVCFLIQSLEVGVSFAPPMYTRSLDFSGSCLSYRVLLVRGRKLWGEQIAAG